MDQADPERSPHTPKKELQLQGPRPPPLKVSKDSHKIRKPPPHPPPKQQVRPFRTQQEPNQPVIIYSVSPKVIHADVADFMSVVQRLTGLSSSLASPPSGAGDLSPAARLASIEKTSPSDRDRDRASSAAAVIDMMDGEGVVQMDQVHPGILSPAPATLPPIPEGFFSPVNDPLGFYPQQELSPFWHSGFMPSPSGLLSAPLISPSPSAMDLFNIFL